MLRIIMGVSANSSQALKQDASVNPSMNQVKYLYSQHVHETDGDLNGEVMWKRMFERKEKLEAEGKNGVIVSPALFLHGMGMGKNTFGMGAGIMCYFALFVSARRYTAQAAKERTQNTSYIFQVSRFLWTNHIMQWL